MQEGSAVVLLPRHWAKRLRRAHARGGALLTPHIEPEVSWSPAGGVLEPCPRVLQASSPLLVDRPGVKFTLGVGPALPEG
eukprot:3435022-Alexandrium_andersonii.AAC.1